MTIQAETSVIENPKTFISYRSARHFDLIAVAFVALLLISNIAATKLINIGPLVFDGGAVLFPLTYLLGDVLSEVYGFKGARRVIVAGFGLQLLASLTFWIVSIAPAGPGDLNHEAFAAILGFVPRMVAASLLGYIVGQLLNSVVLVRIKEKMGEKHLWVRLVTSTLVGEAADTVIFCLVAFGGLISAGDMLNYIITGYIYKVAVEVILLPLTYPVIGAIKRSESAPALR